MIDLDTKLGASLLMVVLTLAVGCGDSETVNERVYLDVFNAYPGTASLSLYGPSGAVATDLGYGQLSDGNPEPTDRNLGTDFTLLLDGAPTTFEVDLPLYDLYPEETATIFFKRRSGRDTVDAPIMFRHLRSGYQSEDRQCQIVLDNALSVDSDHVAEFNYIPAFKIRPSCVGYNLEIGSFDDSAELSVQSQSGRTIPVSRPELFDEIKASPWFIPTEANSGELIRAYNQAEPACGATGDSEGQTSSPAGPQSVKWVWAGRAEFDFESGSFRSPPPTQQYMNCIGWDPDRPPTRQSIKSEQVQRCRRDQNSATPVKLNEEVWRLEFPADIGLDENNEPIEDTCGFAMRMESEFFNVFEGSEEDKKRIERTVTYNPSQYYFWVPYGRPVQPRVQHWSVEVPPPRDPEEGPRGGGYIPPAPYPRADGETSE